MNKCAICGIADETVGLYGYVDADVVGSLETFALPPGTKLEPPVHESCWRQKSRGVGLEKKAAGMLGGGRLDFASQEARLAGEKYPEENKKDPGGAATRGMNHYEVNTYYKELCAWYEEATRTLERARAENEALQTLLLEAWLKEEAYRG